MAAGSELPDRESLVALLNAGARLGATEAELAAAQQAVDALFERYQTKVYQVCLRTVRDPEKAAELAQDTFLTAYQKLGDYSGQGSFYSWLYGIARNKCANERVRCSELLSGDGMLDETDGSRDAFQSLRSNERLALLQAASVAVLDPVEQEAVYLRYERGVSQDDITEILGLTDASGGRGLLQRCRRKLRRELRRRLEELGHTSSFFRDSSA
ncbi:MAG: sigma-70 family RNA polymerase sigma factor [Myxococcota bacterium]